MKALGQSLLIAAVVAATIGAGAYVTDSRSPVPVGATSGLESLLARSLEDTLGAQQSLAQWRGKVLVVNFWATWCPPCVEEIPAFSRLSRDWAAKGVQFVGIGIDQASKIREFASRTQVSYPLLIGPPDAMEIAVALGNSARGLPFTLVFDENGRLRRAHLGRLAESDLAATLSSIL